ncbi:hypothetical protein [Salinirarus marinus]|uniref:hypothetical protein n=1 Tax=Salinirarus marinus TaxID=3068310 RepID=UPI003C6BE9FF
MSRTEGRGDVAPSGTDGRLEVSFSALDEEPGVRISDPIERHQFRLLTDTPVRPSPSDAPPFRFPVDAATRISARKITLPTVVAVYVRDAEGSMLAEAEHFAYEEFPAGTYSIELCAPIKLYLRVDAPVTVASDMAQTRIEFGEETTVSVGARSHHERPAATITTTSDPHDVMTAVSAFSSALKTTSSERSYPTLRGHPPLVELGDHLDVPSGVTPPDTGVDIEIPPDYRSIYVAAPLSYYLGADLVPGDSPRIVAPGGFEHGLDTVRGFEGEVERVLKQTFFFDCLTRTEGYYEVDLYERNEIEDAVDVDFDALYGWPLAEQLRTYLDVPFSAIEPYLPEWKLTTHVSPTQENVELLPFVTDDLAIVRTPKGDAISRSEVQTAAAGEFFRGDALTRSAAPDDGGDRSYVQPEAADSLEQAWIGEGAPIGASKATSRAFHNRLDRSPAEGDIGITVVCNDHRMTEERDTVDDVYGSREDLPFDVGMFHDLTCAELREVLTSQTDFLHYIGHIDGEGFECADGKLDATTLDRVGTDAFLLNACQSYEQGAALVEAGAIAGIVTLTDVLNSGAIRMGRMLARLLNRGFPIGSALEIARDESIIGDQYTIVGDSGLSLARTDGGPPNLCVIRPQEDGYELDWRTYPTTRLGMGSLVMPWIHDEDQYHLSSGASKTFEMTRDELEQFLSLETVPVKIDGRLRWSDDLDEL